MTQRTSLLLALTLACSSASRARAGDPAMSELWPNQDGLSWEYDHSYEGRGG